MLKQFIRVRPLLPHTYLACSSHLIQNIEFIGGRYYSHNDDWDNDNLVAKVVPRKNFRYINDDFRGSENVRDHGDLKESLDCGKKHGNIRKDFNSHKEPDWNNDDLVAKSISKTQLKYINSDFTKNENVVDHADLKDILDQQKDYRNIKEDVNAEEKDWDTKSFRKRIRTDYGMEEQTASSPWPGEHHSSSKFQDAVLNCNDIIVNNTNSDFSLEEGVLKSKIRSAESIKDILQLIRSDVSNMDRHDLVATLESLYKFQKINNTHLTKTHIRNKEEFSLLCNYIKKEVRFMQIGDILTMLKVLKYFQISFQSTLCQMALNMLVKYINDLALNQIVFVDYLIKDADVSPLVKALRISLPIVFKAQVQMGLEFKNVSLMIACLYYAIRRNIRGATFDIIVNNLFSARHVITSTDAFQLVRATLLLNSLEEPQYSFYQFYLDEVRKGIEYNEIEIDDAIFLMNRIARQFKYCCKLFYNAQFFDSVVSYAIDRKLPIDVISRVLQPLNRMGFVSIHILDYLDHIILVNESIKSTMPMYIVRNMIHGYSLAAYKPVNWLMYVDHVRNSLKTVEGRTDLPWLKIFIDIIYLDCCNKQITDIAFKDENVEYLLNKGDALKHRLPLLLAHQAASTLCPNDYVKTPLVADVVKRCIEEYKSLDKDFPLLGTLQHIAGGSCNVLSGVLSKLGHFIDHVIVVNSGEPVPINQYNDNGKVNSGINLHDIRIPHCSVIYGILLMDSEDYALNANRLTGPALIKIRTLESLGVNVIPVSLSVWSRLPDYEKVHRLAREIPFDVPQYKTAFK